ncbi:acyltransferase [Acidocella sp. KAb 2-4]|uniref:acyltransferase family protein n=1 Tax=Acidocella sp. KAb 2-4 TaxID=2885158 RepID=UPI001D066DA4|nr:acyltransferase [Acidocella sp. KAb 2-4]MCB5943594.1 acyltransferase [Acidocella sp. KAb 2-4]
MTAKQEITDLTICRAAFAAWVFTYHIDLYLNFSAWLGPFAGLIRRGYLGVDGFFILSGLILARVHPELGSPAPTRFDFMRALNPAFKAPPRAQLVAFWVRRLARLYPVHLATLLILLGLVAAGFALGWVPRDPGRFGLSALLQNLFLVQGWGAATQGAWNYPSWSISTEWAGYLLFPLLWAALNFFEPIVAVQASIICFTVVGLVFFAHHDSLNLTYTLGLVRFFPEFIAGMAMVRFVPLCADVQAVRRLALVAGLVLSVGGAALGVDLLAVTGLWALLFALLMQADTGWPPLLGERALLRRLGLLSYSFYMSFAIPELVLCQLFRRAGWTPASHAAVFAAGMVAGTFVLAILLYTAVERPCRRAAENWLAARVPV